MEEVAQAEELPTETKEQEEAEAKQEEPQKEKSIQEKIKEEVQKPTTLLRGFTSIWNGLTMEY